MTHKTYYVDMDTITTPRDGKVVVDRWWIVGPKRGPLFYRLPGNHYSNQCNQDIKVAENIRDKLYPGCLVIRIPVAYMGINDEDFKEYHP